MVRVAFRDHCPEFMLKDLLEGFLLPAFEFRMIQKLFSVLVLLRNIENQFRIHHDCSENQYPTILLDKTLV